MSGQRNHVLQHDGNTYFVQTEEEKEETQNPSIFFPVCFECHNFNKQVISSSEAIGHPNKTALGAEPFLHLRMAMFSNGGSLHPKNARDLKIPKDKNAP